MEHFTLLARTTTKDANSGQDVEVFTAGQVLHGTIETQAGNEGEAYGALQSQSDAIITLRQWPAVSALDRVVHRQFAETYVITGVSRQGLNTILQAKKYDELVLADV